MATVTVIIPSYNRKHLLAETLSSVFSQTLSPYEILVVDDGSTDDTRAFLKSYEDRIRYVPKPHGGEASARNRGLSEARGKYIAFLDSDDMWEPSFLETTIQHLERHPRLALLGTACLIIPTGLRRPRRGRPVLEGDLFPLLMRGNIFTASAVVIRRKCLEEVGLFDENLEQATDYDMWLRIARMYPIGFLNQPLCRWREHRGNISQHRLRHRQCVLQVVEANFDPARISQRSFRQRRSKLLVSLGRVRLQLGQVQEAKDCFQRAMKLTPFRVRPWQYIGMAYLRGTVGNLFH